MTTLVQGRHQRHREVALAVTNGQTYIYRRAEASGKGMRRNQHLAAREIITHAVQNLLTKLLLLLDWEISVQTGGIHRMATILDATQHSRASRTYRFKQLLQLACGQSWLVKVQQGIV